MATILAYTSPALGHFLPISALLAELLRRGHTIHLRTLSSAVETGRQLGFVTDPIDPRIEQIELDDWTATNPIAALKLTAAVFSRRAQIEATDLAEAVVRTRPDALLIDVNCWGAQSIADSGSVPWACFSPYTPLLRSPGVPPFGLGLRPMPGAAGRIRDAVVRAAVVGRVEDISLSPINAIRANAGAAPVKSLDQFLRRSSLMLIASSRPFQYQQTDWGADVEMIGPCVLDPGPAAAPDWLEAIDRPIILVTTSSEKQADANLVQIAMTALADEPVHVVATMPAEPTEPIVATPNVTVRRFVPHGVVLDRAVCAITHGGMGATQKALGRGVPVCVVPYGRDQLEVARRVEVAGCGTRLPAAKLSPARLRAKVHEAMAMGAGARRVAAGFEATGGTSRGADLFEQRVLGLIGG